MLPARLPDYILYSRDAIMLTKSKGNTSCSDHLVDLKQMLANWRKVECQWLPDSSTVTGTTPVLELILYFDLNCPSATWHNTSVVTGCLQTKCINDSLLTLIPRMEDLGFVGINE